MTTRLRAGFGAIAFVAALLCACADDPVSPDNPMVVANEFFPTWSPVADTIAFIRARATTAGPAGIYVVGSDGGTPRLVSPGEFHELRYSPDGTLLASAFEGNLMTIVVADDTRSLVLTSERDIDSPEWSPDGTRLVYSRGSAVVVGQLADSVGLHIVDLNSGVDVAMRDSLGEVVEGDQPVWSPEDSLIAFHRDGKIEVWNARTRAISRMLTPPVGMVAFNPIWIEGGRRLLAGEAGAGTLRTVVVDVDTRQPTAWPIYVGPLHAVSPQDTAFVYRDLDPAIESPPTYVLFTRRLADVAGTSIRQLTTYEP